MSCRLWCRERVQRMGPKEQQKLWMDLDELGSLSATAQQLKGPITSLPRLLESNNKIYLYYNTSEEAVGFIKFGMKKMFLFHPNKGQTQLDVMCVLDFFCREAERRRGIGLELMRAMLSDLELAPESLAYDRPSPLLFRFLQRHFNLTVFETQYSFAIFNGFWLRYTGSS